MTEAQPADRTQSGSLPYVERALHFSCEGASLIGVLSLPRERSARRSVLIVVGGPQYRVGSHRQFVLLARRLAEQGYAVLRFDHRGMGDSDGPAVSFEQIGPDIAAATDALLRAAPSIGDLIVWGLCDAASAALLVATRDPRVRGLVLLNPWVRTETGLARAQLKHYYVTRLLQREFWSKVVAGRFDWRGSLQSLASRIRLVLAGAAGASGNEAEAPFQARMAAALRDFDGPVLLILSGNDLTAREFVQFTASDAAWGGLRNASKVQRLDVVDADHTFSRATWRRAVEDGTLTWLTALRTPAPSA